MKFLIILLPLFFFGSCSNAPNEQMERTAFFLAAPELLYFRNLRQTAYTQLPSPKEGMDLYEPKGWPGIGGGAGFNPQIAINWLEDEAYLFLELRSFDGSYTQPFSWSWEINGERDSSVVDPYDLSAQVDLAEQLMNLLSNEGRIWLHLSDGEAIEILADVRERQLLGTCFRDYFRLVGR